MSQCSKSQFRTVHRKAPSNQTILLREGVNIKEVTREMSQSKAQSLQEVPKAALAIAHQEAAGKEHSIIRANLAVGSTAREFSRTLEATPSKAISMARAANLLRAASTARAVSKPASTNLAQRLATQLEAARRALATMRISTILAAARVAIILTAKDTTRIATMSHTKDKASMRAAITPQAEAKGTTRAAAPTIPQARATMARRSLLTEAATLLTAALSPTAQGTRALTAQRKSNPPP